MKFQVYWYFFQLKAKLERIDRRVSLSLQKKTESVSTPLKIDVGLPEESPSNKLNKLHSPSNKNKPSSPRLTKSYSPTVVLNKADASPVTGSKGAKFSELPKKTVSPKSSSPKVCSPRSPRERRLTREAIAKENFNTNLNSDDITTSLCDKQLEIHENDELIKRLRTPLSKRKSEGENDPTPKRAKGGGNISESYKKEDIFDSEGTTNHSLRSRDKTKEVCKNGPKNDIKMPSSPVNSSHEENLLVTPKISNLENKKLKLKPIKGEFKIKLNFIVQTSVSILKIGNNNEHIIYMAHLSEAKFCSNMPCNKKSKNYKIITYSHTKSFG